ncbi:hypothetical protein A2160_04425 [Candidatus Beckwithbacteria bacterium RBG_13_42_9]|uniref:PPM-type phosphatase domain-containing protein n=1 Tax=Candidatus Beckwithbacteria bacterium RBG_13_42_9 TaxID=1797457 RepID=A0A1F5E6E4_9BACT|nr:MAG: hypothetical protein A2160_04425 [Candidatus Beckwithbacteria bacterium RBG_13_42_9]
MPEGDSLAPSERTYAQRAISQAADFAADRNIRKSDLNRQWIIHHDRSTRVGVEQALTYVGDVAKAIRENGFDLFWMAQETEKWVGNTLIRTTRTRIANKLLHQERSANRQGAERNALWQTIREIDPLEVGLKVINPGPDQPPQIKVARSMGLPDQEQVELKPHADGNSFITDPQSPDRIMVSGLTVEKKVLLQTLIGKTPLKPTWFPDHVLVPLQGEKTVYLLSLKGDQADQLMKTLLPPPAPLPAPRPEPAPPPVPEATPPAAHGFEYPKGDLAIRQNPEFPMKGPDVPKLSTTGQLDKQPENYICNVLHPDGKRVKAPIPFSRLLVEDLESLSQDRARRGDPEPQVSFHNFADYKNLLQLLQTAPAGQKIRIGDHLISAESLTAQILEGNQKLHKAAVLKTKRFPGAPDPVKTSSVYAPVLTTEGNVAVLSFGFEDWSRLKDALAGERAKREPRLAAPDRFQPQDSIPDSADPTGQNRFRAEYKTGHITLSQEVVSHNNQGQKQVTQQETGDYEVAMFSDKGIVRENDEDAVFAMTVTLPDGRQIIWYGVRDGMGGHEAGDQATILAAKKGYEWLCSLSKTEEGKREYIALVKEARTKNILIEKLLAEKAVQAEVEAVYQWTLKTGIVAGTTLSGGIISGDKLVVVNIGDSRTYANLDGNGYQQKTVDHSVVASLVAGGVIKPEEAFTHPQRNVIYRTVGDKKHVEVDIEVYDFQPGSSVFVCCDGVWESIKDVNGQKLRQIAQARPPNQKASFIEKVFTVAIPGSDDNLSGIEIVHKVKPKPAQKP